MARPVVRFAVASALVARFWSFDAVVPAVAADPPSGPASAPVADPAAPPPRATIEKPEIDAGEVVKGKEIEATFLVRNDGKGELRLLSVKPG